MKEKTKTFQEIIEKLTPKTQAHLLQLANTAFVAEQSVREELEKKQASKPA